MMFKPLTDAHGEAVLMSYLAASPAPTFPALEREQALTEKPVPCGDTWQGSLAKFDPASSSWRTHQYLLFEDLTECLETFPRWGMMRDGELWEQSTPVLRTDETESGLWPTATAGDSKNAANRTATRHNPNSKHHSGTTLVDAVRMWPTPTVDDANNVTRASGQFQSLTRAIKMFPTPTAQDAKNNGAQSQMLRNTKPLNAEIGGALNPMWVEWLMGWPIGWADCAVSATDKFQRWLRSHGNY
jgi:hypothetical protein